MRPTKSTTGQSDIHRDRYATWFPGLFAYLYAMTGDEEAAKEAAIEAFGSVLPAQSLNDHDFVQALYTAARKIARGRRSAAGDGLSAGEREIISLLFDAQLTRAEAGQLLGLDEATVTAKLLSGLKKLQAKMAAARQGSRLQTLSA